jgi:hypothetical protein
MCAQHPKVLSKSIRTFNVPIYLFVVNDKGDCYLCFTRSLGIERIPSIANKVSREAIFIIPREFLNFGGI